VFREYAIILYSSKPPGFFFLADFLIQMPAPGHKVLLRNTMQVPSRPIRHGPQSHHTFGCIASVQGNLLMGGGDLNPGRGVELELVVA